MLDGVLMRVYEAARTATDRTPTIIVVNPDKKRIVAGLVAAGVLHDEDRPRGANDVARYRMSYQGGGFTQAWVGLGRCVAPGAGVRTPHRSMHDHCTTRHARP